MGLGQCHLACISQFVFLGPSDSRPNSMNSFYHSRVGKVIPRKRLKPFALRERSDLTDVMEGGLDIR